MTDREKIKEAIENGAYKKKELAELIDVSVPTFRKFLEQHPDLEELRANNQPRVAEKGRSEYLKKYNQQYERKDDRTEYMKKRDKERWQKNKAAKEAAKLALLVSENEVKADKVDEANGASNQIMLF